MVRQGNAVFDHEPQSVCFALFLDFDYALLLETSNERPMKFKRIGLAVFLVSDMKIITPFSEETKVTECSKNNTGGLAFFPGDYATVIIF
jgi:hypothetical protein